MQIINLTPLLTGAYLVQSWPNNVEIPDGFATIPEDMQIPSTFPFVHVEAEDGIVTKLTPNQEAYDAALAEHQPEEQNPVEPRNLFVDALLE